jgi:hypothetical protein
VKGRIFFRKRGAFWCKDREKEILKLVACLWFGDREGERKRKNPENPTKIKSVVMVRKELKEKLLSTIRERERD